MEGRVSAAIIAAIGSIIVSGLVAIFTWYRLNKLSENELINNKEIEKIKIDLQKDFEKFKNQLQNENLQQQGKNQIIADEFKNKVHSLIE